MKTTRHDGSNVRRILAAMVTDPTVCSRISSKWKDGGLFDAKWANLVGGWCVKHNRKYGTPPNKRINAIFERWVERTNADSKTVDTVEAFLVAVSDDSTKYKDTSEFILDLADEHFNEVRLRSIFEEGLLDLEQGSIEQAEQRLVQSHRVELGVGSFIEPADDYSVWEQAFSRDRTKPLVTYPGALGDFTHGSFLRGEFYSFLAPDKTGKTANLIDFAYRAVRRRNRVAYFECGDGDQDEVLMKLGCRLTNTAEYAGSYECPVGVEEGELLTVERDYKQVNEITAFRTLRKLARNETALRVSSHPSSTISAHGIDAMLEDWARDDWRPDVVVIDYADILAAPSGLKDRKEQIDETWKQLRRMSQRRHCLVMTATQADSGGYKRGKWLLGRDNFSGAKEKNAHVNGILGINVDDDEYALQMARWNWVVRRRDQRKDFVHVAGCFPVGNPAAFSWF